MSDRPTLASLFQAQAASTPEAEAVVTGVRSIRYGDLYRRAEAIAGELVRRGLQPETLVGLSTERSIEMIVGVFGILLAGGAYVPLAPSLPVARLDQMIQDARLEWALVVDKPLWSTSVTHTISLKGIPKSWFRNAELPIIHPEQLAYVLYTSGSTGKPKGAMLEHRNVTSHLAGIEQVAPRRLPLVGSQVAPYTFDASVWEIFSNLCYGGVLHIIPRLDDVPALAEYLLDHRVNSSFLPPGILDDLVERLARRPSEVRLDRLMVGVETIPQRTLQHFLDLNPEMRIVNGYGPTETVVCATYYLFKTMTAPNAPAPIGSALPGYSVRLIDDNLQPVPPGEAGEVLIGGAGVGRGYLNDPALTSARFVPDPFAGKPGERAYRTGDYARQLPDGNLEFVGRQDNQVKIRGYRVEIGDVEAAILESPQVKAAVVTALADPINLKRLVAYVIFDPPQPAPALADLRNFLTGRLPEYMLPSLVIPVENIPRTAHGKVDFSALPAPDWTQRRMDTPMVRPRTTLEERLAAIWSQLLGVNEISVEDNFFDLGGDSLLAARLLARIEQAFCKTPSISTIFESPKLADLAVRLECWQPATETAESPQPIQPTSGHKIPLAYSQQRLWFLAELEPDSPAYHNPFILRLSGDLNLQALLASLNAIIARHAILRTTFFAENGAPYQVIADRLIIDLPVIDLSDLPEETRRSELLRQLETQTYQPFDLGRGPLIRCTLFLLDNQNHVLLVNLHHLIFDAWSIGIFLQELQQFYTMFCEKGLPVEEDAVNIENSAGLSPLPIQYTDYAAWEQQGGQEALFEKQLAFWKQLLGISSDTIRPGSLPRLNLPTDYPRQAARLHSGEGGVCYLRLGGALLERLNTLSQQTNTTLFMVMFSAFITLLYRYTGQEDILVGSYLANRNLPEIQGLIGSFINPVVLRARFSGTGSFIELLQQIRQMALAAYDNQEMPIESLIEALTAEQEFISRSPFEVAFNYINTPRPKLSFPDLEVEEYAPDIDTKVYDLHVEDLLMDVMPDEAGLLIKLQYKTALFETRTIDRLIAHFQRLLEGITTNPSQKLAELPLLTHAEQRQILVEWNDTHSNYPREASFPQLFEQQVEKTPHSIAVAYNDQALTYQELNGRANQLAHHLQALGVGPATLVGLFLERSLEAMVGLLGILKAGGVYLPLDPNYPKERLEFMLQDSQAPLILTQERLLDHIPTRDHKLVFLDKDWPAIAQHSRANPTVAIQPADPVYIIYTSGSTGRPKGVLIPHRALVNHNLAIGKCYDLHPGDRVLQFALLSFDVAAEEIFASWLSGASVVLYPGWQVISLTDFTAFIGGQGISVLNLPASFWQAWVEEMSRSGATLPSVLRLVVVGSEQVLTRDWQAWRKLVHPRIRWLNAYGTSETTITSTIFEPVPDWESQTGYSVPIGRPIANTQAYILNTAMQPVPVGVSGELCLGGDGLALGYLNQPELNAEKFVAWEQGGNDKEPPSEVGARLYKTGDLARYLPDGNIEFLGRADEQVKMRGYRVELGEIESLLGGYPSVQQAAVVARENGKGEKRLVAYLSPEPGKAFEAQELRTYLKSKLPDYMIPTAYLILEALPLLPNGKVDRRALPTPDNSWHEELETYVAPRSAIEQRLVDIWARILGFEKVGIDDNFFELGGHSLLAVRLMSEISREFNQSIPLIELFEHPTISQLAPALENRPTDQSLEIIAPAYEPIKVIRPEQGPLPASYGEFRMWLVSLLEPDNPSYNITFALHMKGTLQPARLEASLNQVIQRHEILRTCFPAPDGRPVRSIAPSLTLSLPVEDLSGLASEAQKSELEQRLRQLANQLFNLAALPLVRWTLYRLDENEHILMFSIPHIIFDDWSRDVFLEELWMGYTALASGLQPALPDVTLQYADYALWQQGESYNRMVESQSSYWQEQLSGDWPRTQLPADHPRPANPSNRGATQFLEVPEETLKGLKVLAQQNNCTLYIVLLAAFKALLHHSTGEEDLLVWSFVSNRNRPEVQRMIGILINYVALRTKLTSDLPFTEALKRVRETALGAYKHPDVPIEKLLANLWSQLQLLDFRALFMAVFNFINLAQDNVHVPGLQVDEYPFDPEMATFDLYAEIVEKPDRLLLAFRYTPELYEPETIRKVMKDYRALLEAVVEDPRRTLEELGKRLQQDTEML